MDHSIFQILICKKNREKRERISKLCVGSTFFLLRPPPPWFYVLFTAKLSKNLINDEEDVWISTH